MSPVEPSPLVMGTMGLPSIGVAGNLGFLVNMPSAFNFTGASKPPLIDPRAAKNERRFQPDFRVTLRFLSTIYSPAGGLTTRALPTISISESPGIHSSAMQAREGVLPGLK